MVATVTAVKTWHDAETGADVLVDPLQVQSYSPTWGTGPGWGGTTLHLADDTRVLIREKFREFHTWIDPNWPPARGRRGAAT